MGAKGALKKYFLDRIGEIKDLLKKKSEAFTIENFHQLRVETKKLRALSEMLDSANKNIRTKKVIEPLKEIYDQAGKIRELQLETVMIKQQHLKPSPKEFMRELHEQVQKEKKKFYSLHKELGLKPGKLGRTIVDAIHHATEKKLFKYLKTNKKKIKRVLAPVRIKSKRLHEVRKSMKRIFYNMKSMGISEDILALKKGDELLQLIGEWHDAVVMKKHLETAVAKKKVVVSEIKKIGRVVRKLGVREQGLYAKINKEKQGNLFLSYRI